MATAPSTRSASLPRTATLLRQALLPVGVSLGTMALVLGLTYEPGLRDQVATAIRWPWVGVALVAALSRLAFGGAWVRFLSERRLSWWQGTRSYLAREFFSAITPSAVGGAPLAATAVGKSTVLSVGEAASVLVFVMVMDHVWYVLVALVVLIASGSFALFPAENTFGFGVLVAYSIGLAAWTTLLAYATIVRTAWLGKAIGVVTKVPGLRRFQTKISGGMERLEIQAARFRGRSVRFYATSLGYAALTNLSRYALIVAVLWSFVPDVPALLTVARAAVLWLVALVMPTPGGAGGVEGLFLLFFGAYMMGALKAPILLFWRLLDYALVLALGVASTAATVQRMVIERLWDEDGDSTARVLDGVPTADLSSSSRP
ncbi:MAG: lysylphosphatidylglycerol synthase transmembrane domain-containing protein [Bacteroidota bacterium]